MLGITNFYNKALNGTYLKIPNDINRTYDTAMLYNEHPYQLNKYAKSVMNSTILWSTSPFTTTTINTTTPLTTSIPWKTVILIEENTFIILTLIFIIGIIILLVMIFGLVNVLKKNPFSCTRHQEQQPHQEQIYSLDDYNHLIEDIDTEMEMETRT